jgi:hypothetical protein
VQGREQAPKRFNLAIFLIWHGIMMSKVVKRFTVYFVLKSQQVPMKKSALNLWRLCPLRISYPLSTMTNEERMQRESSLLATIRRKLPDFVKACADDTELVLLHQDAFAADYQEHEYGGVSPHYLSAAAELGCRLANQFQARIRLGLAKVGLVQSL